MNPPICLEITPSRLRQMGWQACMAVSMTSFTLWSINQQFNQIQSINQFALLNQICLTHLVIKEGFTIQLYTNFRQWPHMNSNRAIKQLIHDVNICGLAAVLFDCLHPIMSNQNCIEVKYVNNLSIPYLTRFFGSAGPVLKVEKNQNSKYVTIEFANKFSAEKALKFEGRVLDKDPIKIKIFKLRNGGGPPVEGTNTLTTNSMNRKQKESLINLKETLQGSGKFKEEIWSIIFSEFRRREPDQNRRLINSMFLWRLTTLLMNSAKHFERFRINLRGHYILYQIEREIIDRLQKKHGSLISCDSFRQSSLEFRQGKAWVWYEVPYPNTEEGSLCCTTYSAQSKCIQKIANASPMLGEIIHGLYSSSLIYNLEETSVEEILQLEYQLLTTEEDNFVGIAENIGVKDLFHDLVAYEQPNSCIYLSETSNHPENFECSLRLIGCHQAIAQEKGWCDFYEAVVWRRWTSKAESYYHIEVKEQVSKAAFAEHNLYFEESQFSIEAMCQQSRKYQLFQLSNHMKVFYVRKQRQASMNPPSFDKIYEDEVMKIEDEVENHGKVKSEEVNFHQEVVLNVFLVEIRFQGHAALNQLKLEHYLQDYIEESINSKGLIVASLDMAYKLAANIIEREKDSRLFEFAHSRFQRYIGDELWRLYCKQSERKIKNNLVHYQLGKK